MNNRNDKVRRSQGSNYLLYGLILLFVVSTYYSGIMAKNISQNQLRIITPISLTAISAILIPVVVTIFLHDLKRWLRVALLLYFIWVILFTVVSLPSWIKQAVNFKLHGGPEIVNQLYSAKYDYWSSGDIGYTGNGYSMPMELKYPDLPWGQSISFDYFWGADSHQNANAKYDVRPGEVPGYQFTKLGRNWAIRASTTKSEDFNPYRFRRFLKDLTVKSDARTWHPMAEVQFLNYLSNHGQADPSLVAFNPLFLIIGVGIVFLTASVLEVYILTAAFSPPQIIYFTMFLPICVAIVLVAKIASSLSEDRKASTRPASKNEEIT